MCKDAYPMEGLSNILVLSNNHGNKYNGNTNKVLIMIIIYRE